MIRDVVLACAILALACSRVREGVPAQALQSAAAADSAVGRIAEVGSDPSTWMVLQPSGGGTALRLSGTSVGALRAVAGADVRLLGTRNSAEFRVDGFEVRRVNGQSVDDGVIDVSTEGVTIRLQSGRSRGVPNAPEALRRLTGARVWISRPVDGVAPSFGVIQRP